MIDGLISASAETGLAVAALLALVLLARRTVTQRFGARAAYALWALPVLRLVTPPISLPADWGISRWINHLTATTADPAPLYTAYYTGPAVLPAAPTGLSFADIWPPALLSIWLLGVMLGAVVIIMRQRRYTHRLRRTSLAPNTVLQAEISHAVRQSGLKKSPDVRVSLDNDGPMVCGVLRPVIILPTGFCETFTAEQRRLALLHELTHIRRHDLWTASAMMAFRLLNWPNPLVHLAWPRFRADQEAACDAAVLRLTGEDARANYAETLLTAARTAGRANPTLGTGLTLSLHHPVKERLMTLGTSTQKQRGAGRWGLAALLLAGAALTAPLSLADGPETPDAPKVITTSKSVHVVRADFEGDKDGYEIREEDGVKTYLRVSRDGTTENLTKEQLEAEYDIDVEALLKQTPPTPPNPPRFIARLDGEPGLNALSAPESGTHVRTMILNKASDGDSGSYEVKVENGVKSVFRIDEDGTRTTVSEDEMGAIPHMETIVINGSDRFPTADGEKKIRIFTTSNEMSKWVSGDEDGQTFAFVTGDGNAGTAMADARLRSAQSMLESTDRMLAEMREGAAGDAVKDLRKAERELLKAQKALKKAQAALQKSGDR